MRLSRMVGSRRSEPQPALLPRRRKLAFEHDPGTTYGYSGEGYEYLARAMERKLSETFPRLVASKVLEPLGMTRTVLATHREGVPKSSS